MVPWTTALWVALAVGLLFAVAYAAQYYKLPPTEVSVLRTVIVLIAGFRVIRVIERAMNAHRARKLEAVTRGEAGTALSWQDSVTGVYLVRLLLYAGLGLITIFVVGGTFSGFVVGGTLLSVTLGVAGQSFFANFFGGLAVALFKPFEIGDHVQIIAWQFPMMPETYPHLMRAQGYRGVIRDINLFYSELRLDDGQLFRVPNGIVITAGLIRSQPDDWARIIFRFDVVIPDDAGALLRELQNAAASHFRPRPEEPPPSPTPGTPEAAAEAAKAAPPFGWDPPRVLVIDISPTAMSIEVQGSVPQRLRDRAKADFFTEVLPVVHPVKPA